MPMARRQRAGRPANGPIEHDPDRPLLTQMQLQLPNLPELITQLVTQTNRPRSETARGVFLMSSRRSPGTRGGSATRWAVDPAAAPGGRSTPPESRKASSRPAGSGSEFNEES